MKKLTSREIQALETKEKILNKSLEMMMEVGFDQVKISEICQQTGVSVGAFYHHFGSKEGIIIAGYSECDRYFDETVVKSIQEGDPVLRVVEYLRYQAKYAEDMGVDLLVQVYKSQLTDGTDFFLSMERSLPKNLLTLIKEAQTLGRLSEIISAEEILEELLIISRGCIYNWCQNQGTYHLEEKMTRLVSQYLISYQQ